MGHVNTKQQTLLAGWVLQETNSTRGGVCHERAGSLLGLEQQTGLIQPVQRRLSGCTLEQVHVLNGLDEVTPIQPVAGAVQDVVRVQFGEIERFVLQLVLRNGHIGAGDQGGLQIRQEVHRQASTFGRNQRQPTGHLLHLDEPFTQGILRVDTATLGLLREALQHHSDQFVTFGSPTNGANFVPERSQLFTPGLARLAATDRRPQRLAGSPQGLGLVGTLLGIGTL